MLYRNSSKQIFWFIYIYISKALILLTLSFNSFEFVKICFLKYRQSPSYNLFLMLQIIFIVIAMVLKTSRITAMPVIWLSQVPLLPSVPNLFSEASTSESGLQEKEQNKVLGRKWWMQILSILNGNVKLQTWVLASFYFYLK